MKNVPSVRKPLLKKHIRGTLKMSYYTLLQHYIFALMYNYNVSQAVLHCVLS